MRRNTVIAALVGLITCIVAQPALAVIIFLKGQDQPIRGFLVRENEHVVVINQLLPDETIKERTIPRTEIDDMIQTVSTERLESLQPDDPDKYREYAEELAEKSKDPDARITAVRLFLIAAHLAPERLGRSCLLGMVPLAGNDDQQRQFRAMAYLLDPTHDPDLLSMPVLTTSPKSSVDPRQGEFMLHALRLLRQGKRHDALVQSRRIKMQERLHLLTDTITFAEFEQACEPTCPHCNRGRQPCPDCKELKFVLGKACTTCGARGTVRCAHCTDYRINPLPPSLLKRIVQLELDWLPSPEPQPETPRPPHLPWAQSVQQGQSAPLLPLSLETVTKFDPRKNIFRDGKWKS